MAAVAAPDERYVLAKDVLEQRQRVQVLLRDGIIEDLRFEEGGGGRRPSGRTMMVRESFTKNPSSDGFFVRQDTMPHPSLHTSLWSSLESSYLLEQKPEHRQRNSRETHRRLVKVDKVGDHGVWSSDWSVDTPLGTQEVAGSSDVLIDEVDQPKPSSSAASLKKPKAATIVKPKRKYVKKKKVIEEVKGNVVSLSGVETKKITKQRSLSWNKEGTKSQSHAEDGSPRLGLGNLAPKGGRASRRTPSSKAKVDHMGAFLAEIGNTGLLTKDQEIEFTVKAKGCMKLEQIQLELTEELSRVPTMDEWSAYAGVTTQELQQRLHAGRDAKRLMVEHNIRLAVHVARKYCNKGVPLGDLVQEGLTGLVKAIEKFNPDLGFRFSTYAHYWVRQGITRAISDQSRTIRLPVHVYDTLSKIRKARVELDEISEEGPSNSAIAQHIGIPEAKVKKLLLSSLPLLDLDGVQYQNDASNDNNETARVESVESEESDDSKPESSCEMRFLKEDLEQALADLHPRERNILCMRYGLATADGSIMTLKDIGRAYGLTRERIRQIEDRALRKLRHPCSAVSLVDYLHVISD
eukprot:CAMPEP_0198225680 /NCGR_PEP_ID=MMETSP1445-20131203/102138_1 /TAXON_ID=36898 /ORGANISM="Pyramimonas sp., Strain CCMP2087" /LENGTH=576 /DNA_ID=CAMNT_0043905275 /DNA_START=365 /DNA_END=2095 /DNA_ORIENTATION=+